MSAKLQRNLQSRNIPLLLTLFQKYPYGISRKKMIQEGHIQSVNLVRAWSRLRKDDIIKRIAGSLFILDQAKVTDSSGDTTINIHAIQLSFPIISDNIDPDFWDSKNDGFKNSKVYYKRINSPIGMTIQKNTKQVTVQVWARDVRKPEEIESLMLRASLYAWHYLKEHGLEVDIFQVEKKNIDIAIKNNDLKGIVGTKDKIEVGLDRPVSKLFSNDKDKEAKAWYDSSPTSSVETNDIEYAKRYLRTPEMVTTILETQERFSKNLELHLQVLQEIRDALKHFGK